MSFEEWTRGTASRTGKGALVFTPIMLVAVVGRGVVTGRSELLTVTNLGGVVAVCVIASFVYAALAPARSTRLGYYLSWVVSGAVSLCALVLLAFLAGMPLLDDLGGDEHLVSDPMFWAFWAAAGGVTGFAYGRIAWSATDQIE